MDAALGDVSRFQVTVPARPTTQQQDGQTTAMVIRDREDVHQAPGTYELTVACAGRGTLIASLSIGERTSEEVLPACTQAGMVAPVRVTSTEGGPDRQVMIAPVGDSSAVVRYGIARLP